MKNHNRGFIIPLVLAIIAVVAIGAGIYYYQKSEKLQVGSEEIGNPGVSTSTDTNVNTTTTSTNQNAQTKSATSTSGSASTASWKTYTNSEYGFSFQYPLSYGQITQLQDGSIAIGQNGSSNVVISLPKVILNNNGQPESLSDITTLYNIKGWTETTLTIGGIKSLKISSSQNGDEVFVPLSNNQILTINGDSRDSLFNQMLTTFKFNS